MKNTEKLAQRIALKKHLMQQELNETDNSNDIVKFRIEFLQSQPKLSKKQKKQLKQLKDSISIKVHQMDQRINKRGEFGTWKNMVQYKRSSSKSISISPELAAAKGIY